MSGYLINFSIYTTAMIGIIFLALFVFKKASGGCFTKKSSTLNIEETLKLSARKTLYIINAENERFLVAADIDRTSLISKLDSKTPKKLSPIREDKSTNLSSFDGVTSLSDFASIVDLKKERLNKGPMMKELARKLNTI